jgi:imidazole glycerol-phosphate synthase
MIPTNEELSTGDQYDVREGGTGSGGDVRNLGKPVSLAQRYFKEGADEISFLNITGFRDFPLEDLPMLEVCAAQMWCRADDHCRVS